jgi:hypothetical protein
MRCNRAEVDMMDRERFEQLYAARQEAQDTVNAHFQTLRRAIGYGDTTEWKGERVLDREWLDEHSTLRNERDKAEERLSRYLLGEEART